MYIPDDSIQINLMRKNGPKFVLGFLTSGMWNEQTIHYLNYGYYEKVVIWIWRPNN